MFGCTRHKEKKSQSLPTTNEPTHTIDIFEVQSRSIQSGRAISKDKEDCGGGMAVGTFGVTATIEWRSMCRLRALRFAECQCSASIDLR